jgi:hypothetical protein
MAGTKGTPRSAGKQFSERAVSFLVGYAGVRTVKSIANSLGRTPKAIQRKAEKLGISLAVNN